MTFLPAGLASVTSKGNKSVVMIKLHLRICKKHWSGLSLLLDFKAGLSTGFHTRGLNQCMLKAQRLAVHSALHLCDNQIHAGPLRTT